jgi:hypothetical protein
MYDMLNWLLAGEVRDKEWLPLSARYATCGNLSCRG